MVIVLTGAGGVVLEQPDDFRAFSVRVPAGVDDGALRTGPLADVVAFDDTGHGWIAPAAVRSLAGALAGDPGPAWTAGFAAMSTYAAGKGWVDAAGRLRAHVEREPVPT